MYFERTSNSSCLQTNTVSTLLQPRGSIFQNRFFGGVQFKFGYNLTTVWPKTGYLTGVLLEFVLGGVLFESRVQITSIQ